MHKTSFCLFEISQTKIAKATVFFLGGGFHQRVFFVILLYIHYFYKFWDTCTATVLHSIRRGCHPPWLQKVSLAALGFFGFQPKPRKFQTSERLSRMGNGGPQKPVRSLSIGWNNPPPLLEVIFHARGRPIGMCWPFFFGARPHNSHFYKDRLRRPTSFLDPS